MTHTPGPLEAAQRKRFDDLRYQFKSLSSENTAEAILAIWRHLDTLSKPDIGIPISPADDERLRIAVEALERVSSTAAQTSDYYRVPLATVQEVDTALSRIKELSNDR